jgi:ABC-type transporter Mla subunit MlaD
VRKGRFTTEQFELRSLIEQLKQVASELNNTSRDLEEQVKTLKRRKEIENDE